MAMVRRLQHDCEAGCEDHDPLPCRQMVVLAMDKSGGRLREASTLDLRQMLRKLLWAFLRAPRGASQSYSRPRTAIQDGCLPLSENRTPHLRINGVPYSLMLGTGVGGGDRTHDPLLGKLKVVFAARSPGSVFSCPRPYDLRLMLTLAIPLSICLLRAARSSAAGLLTQPSVV
jgi:hypothetical protein